MKLKTALISLGLAACCLLTGCKPKTQPGNIGNEVILADGDLIAEITIENYGTMKAKLFPDIAPVAVENFQKLCKKNYYNGLKIHYVTQSGRIQGGSLSGDGTGGEAAVNTNGYFPNEVSPDARHFFGALGMANQNGRNTTQFYIVNSQKIEDITQYSPDKLKEKAAEFTAKLEGMENTDPDYDSLKYQETMYTELANMLSDASAEVIEKYATKGGVPLWDGGSTIFGQVFEGLDILEKITGVETTGDNQGNITKPVEDIIITSITVTEYVAPEPEPEENDKKDNKKKK